MVAKERNYEMTSIAQQQMTALHVELNILAYICRLKDRPPHPNIVRLIGATTTIDNEFCLMTEYCKIGSLEKYLQEKYRNKQFINEIVQNGAYRIIWKCVDDNCFDSAKKQFIKTRDLLSYAEQIASAMQYLSSKNILHRDVALRNVFLKTTKTIKLGDFGLSRKLPEGKLSYVPSKVAEIPIRYTAFESLIFSIYTIESEIWTFGVVLWELFTFAQTAPYDIELPNLSVDSLKNFLSAGKRLATPDTAPIPIQKLMQTSWSEIAKNRPNFQLCQTIIRHVLDDANHRPELATAIKLPSVVASSYNTQIPYKEKALLSLAVGTTRRVTAIHIGAIILTTVALNAIAFIAITTVQKMDNGGGLCHDYSSAHDGKDIGVVNYQPTSWFTAQAACAKFGANLVSIHSNAENSFVCEIAAAHPPMKCQYNYYGTNCGTWIGLSKHTNSTESARFRWNDGTLVDYVKFKAPLGDNAEPNDWNCVLMQTDPPTNINEKGYWFNYQCETHDLRAYVCKKPADH